MSNPLPSDFADLTYSVKFNRVPVRITADERGKCHLLTHDLKRAWGLLADNTAVDIEDNTSKLGRDEALYLTAVFLGEGAEAILRSEVERVLAAITA